MSHLSLRGRKAPEAISEQRNEIASLRYALGRLPQKARLAMTGKVAQCGSLLKCDIVEVVTLFLCVLRVYAVRCWQSPQAPD